MESHASGSRSKKRGFSSAEISEPAPSMSKPSKKKEVYCEIIYIDSEDDEVMIIDEKKGKAKGIASSVFEPFKKFDIVNDYSDHFYAMENMSKKVNPPKNWANKIQQEWEILESGLPDRIFVRVYESRMDLLRAVIVGAEGTPYHDGLFFFDVFFPCEYPDIPPKVYYHSGGLRINPNLYVCGTVCLSLLGTWGGTDEEKWLPKVSTMLQVLVSIQGLILNAEPYYNEPIIVVNKNGSLKYNEMAFICNLKTMVYTIKRPPNHFEALVTGYFCKHAHDILESCKAYLDGAQVGCLVRGGVQDLKEGEKSCSGDFKCSLAKFIPTLIGAFKQIGAKGCDRFLSLAQQSHSNKLKFNGSR